LRTIRQALAMIPDGKLLESLRAACGRGRDDYPVEVLWGVVVHEALATLLAATPRRHGPLGKMHLGPIQKALQQGLAP